MKRFIDKVVIITGGADGLGKGTSHRIASEGGRIIIFDNDRNKLEKTREEFENLKFKVDTSLVDVRDEEGIKNAIQSVVDKYKRLDIMINCAGIVGPTNTKIIDYPSDAFDTVYFVNLKGSFLMTKYSLLHMLENNKGKILLVASISGKEGNPGMCGYSSSKAGVIGLVKAIGKEYADTGITINGIAPSVIHTALIDGIAPEQVKYMKDRIPMGRFGTVEEFVSLSTWIASDECTFCTGFVFDLSGGRATY